MKYIEKTRIRTHIYTYIRIYARERFTVALLVEAKKRSKDMNETKEELDKALDSLIEKSKRTDERLQAIRDAEQAMSDEPNDERLQAAIRAAGEAMINGLNDGLLMTQGRWCNRIHCQENKMNWCKKDVCTYGLSLTYEPDFAKAEMDFTPVDPHNDAKPSELIQKILKEVEKRL